MVAIQIIFREQTNDNSNEERKKKNEPKFLHSKPYSLNGREIGIQYLFFFPYILFGFSFQFKMSM